MPSMKQFKNSSSPSSYLGHWQMDTKVLDTAYIAQGGVFRI
jgi:hypothetical protein